MSFFFLGAPASWEPPPTIETHRPLIFLNIASNNDVAGLQATLCEEIPSKMLPLSLIQNASDEVCYIKYQKTNIFSFCFSS